MKRSNNKLSYALCVSLILVFSSCVQERVKITPTKPLIIIEIEAINPGADHAYRYKLADKEGYVFYMTESAAFREQPKRMIGDTVR